MSASIRKSPGSSVSSARSTLAAVEQQLAHMADVEQAGILADPQMLGHDAFILDRHLIAGERHHPRAPGAVPAVERQCAPDVSLVSITPRVLEGPSRGTTAPRSASAAAPFCRGDLRALPPGRSRASPSVALRRATDAFQTVRRARSLVPERFRGRLLLRRSAFARSDDTLPRAPFRQRTAGDERGLGRANGCHGAAASGCADAKSIPLSC